MKSLYCCVVVLSLYALCEGLRESVSPGLGTSVKTPKWKDIQERSRTEPLVLLRHHNAFKRAADLDGEACTSLKDYESRLANNTHMFAFNDLSGSVSLAWVGDGTGVLLVLTTFHVPFFLVRFGQSKLYRSEDYGKTFMDVTNLINHTFIQTEMGFAIGPENSGKVILTGAMAEAGGSRIFRSVDFGKSFFQADLPFFPRMQISFSPQNNNVLLATSTKHELWLSEDFGFNWTNIHEAVCLVKWGRENTIFFTTNANGSCTDRGSLELRKTSNFGRTFQTIRSRVYSFGLGGRFIFASIMTGTGTQRMIHVSVDQGEVWDMAQLPTVGHQQFYSILAANDVMIFMHVDEPGDADVGTIYVSDDRGTVYSRSLEHHLYTTTGGDTDFTNITSLRGVYMTTVMTKDGSVKTMVTFDQGGEWQPLRRPWNIKCDAIATSRQEGCSLHIHALYSLSMSLNVPMLPLSEPSAVGLVLAHGSVGERGSVLSPDVYVSDDGGYSWFRALKGPHHYDILDSGALLVAVEHSPSNPISQIKFSTDEGQCWHVFNFTREPLFFTGLTSEPAARSMNVSIWGYRQSAPSQYWVSVTIDFSQLLSRDCGEEDYVQWLAHSDDVSSPTDGCVLGFKERFLRLKKDSVCWNGRDYVITSQPTLCPCTLEDFHCDFGFYRVPNGSECVEQPELKGHALEFCRHGRKEQLQTHGYRKIPGDRCVGGAQPERKEIDLRTKCTSDLLRPELTVLSINPAVVVAVVIGVLLICVVVAVLLIKKYVCGGRFLVHRYSVLQQHAEANGIEGVDEMNTHTTERTNDDSDEDLLD